MKRLIFPVIGLLAALWAGVSVARTQPRRHRTEPPAPPPVSDFAKTVAAVGLGEASTENISVGTPLGGVVAKVFVTAGQAVEAGDPLFELDVRQLRADLAVRQHAVTVARARAAVAGARLADLERQLEFAEQVKDRRAISAEELSSRRSAVETATAQLEEARAQLAPARAEAPAPLVENERRPLRSPLHPAGR